jgi:hypothetical protein
MATQGETVGAFGSTPATFKISDFKRNIGKLARPNYFRARIFGPTGVGVNIADTFSFRCEKAEFPGKSIATVDDPGGGGTILKLPYDVTYNDITLSIICSADMKERIYFDNWMNLIVKPAGDRGGLIQYHTEYARDNSLTVEQLDEQNNILLRWAMNDVYPIAISAMNAVWDELNTYQRFEVTLTYRYYELELPPYSN